jgi:hypothetical protein
VRNARSRTFDIGRSVFGAVGLKIAQHIGLDMVSKPSPAVYLSEDLRDFLGRFDSNHKFNKWISDMKSVLKENMFAGDCVPKRQIPDRYKRRYGINNLYHYTHPEGYRSCYALLKYEGLGVCPLILDLLTHPEYDKIFGYRAS